MKDVMVIESRDPIMISDTEWGAELVRGMAAAGARSCMMLVENGVIAARNGAAVPWMDALKADGVAVVADRYALRERGIGENELAEGVIGAELGIVIDWLDAGARILWR